MKCIISVHAEIGIIVNPEIACYYRFGPGLGMARKRATQTREE
jgi:hypothetical protein